MGDSKLDSRSALMEFGWWFVCLWGMVVVLALWSKSLLVTVGLIVCSLLGVFLTYPETLVESARYGIILVLLLVSVFGILQMLFKVERL